MIPFTIVAHKPGQQRTLQLMARDKASAILLAQELLPGWLLSIPFLSPDWQ
jgi:hypothetical protein